MSVPTDTLETAELAPVFSATTLLNIVMVDYSVAICIYICLLNQYTYYHYYSVKFIKQKT